MRLRRIDPIQQRTGDPLLVFRHHGVRTGAGLLRITIPAARTGVYTIGHVFHVKRAMEELF